MKRGHIAWALAALVGAGLLVRFAGAPAAHWHVRTMTGQSEVTSLACWNCHGPKGALRYDTGRPHPDPRRFAAAADGTLFVTLGPIRRVARVDALSGESRMSAELAGPPRGLALAPDGAELAVTLGTVDQVAILSTESLDLETSIAVGAEPTGLTFDREAERLFVANTRSGDISVIDVARARESHRIAAGREPFAVALSPDGATVVVASRTATVDLPTRVPASELTMLDARSGVVRKRLQLSSIHLVEDLEFTADGRYLLAPGIRTRNLLPILQVARGWVMSSVLSVIDLQRERVVPLPLGDVNVTHPDPSGIAIDDARRRVWVASGGANSIAELDLDEVLRTAAETDPDGPERFADATRYVISRRGVGRNPRDIALIGNVIAVAERLDDTIGMLVPASDTVRHVPVGPPVPPDEVRRGDAVFHDASYAFQGSFSCRSCHPEGHTDGLTYDFDIDGVGRNVVLNRSLRGVKGTAPFKWIGLNPTLERQCGPRFAMVLTRADPFPEPKLRELVAYIESLSPPRADPSAGRVSNLETGTIERGRRLFTRERRKNGEEIAPSGRCVTCHSGPHYSNLLKADVGTGTPFDSGGEFDVPHLTGIGSKAPYLHDGRATSLEQIWTLPGVGDQHGVVTDLSKADLNDLIEFLKTL